MTKHSLCFILPLAFVAWSAPVAAGGWHSGSALGEAGAQEPVVLARRGGFAPMRVAPMRGGGGGYRMPSTAPRGGYGVPNRNPFQSPFSAPMGSRGRPPAMMPSRPPVQTAPARPTEPLPRVAPAQPPASVARPPLAAPRSPLDMSRRNAMTDSGRLGAAGGVSRLLAARAGLPRATPSALGGPLQSAAARSGQRMLLGAAAGGLAAYAFAPRPAASAAPANPSSPLERSNQVVEGVDRDGDFRRYRIREFVRAEGTRLVSWRHVKLERHGPAPDAPVARAWAASSQRQLNPAAAPGAQEAGRGQIAGQRGSGDAALRYGVRRADDSGTDLWLWVMDHPLSPGFGARYRVDDAAIQQAQVSAGVAGN